MKKTTLFLTILLIIGSRANAPGAEEFAPKQAAAIPTAQITNSAIPWHFSSPVASAKAEFSTLRSLGSLLVVLGCLLLLTWFLKKRAWGASIIRSQRRMQIIEKLGVGQRQYLALVRIDGEDMLIGISPERITELGFTPTTACEKTVSQGGVLPRAEVVGKS